MDASRATGKSDTAPAEAAVGELTCAFPGCQLAGEFRAPRDRDRLNDYLWFCLAHVREYNAAWNYYANMDDLQIEAEIRNDIVWRRPTWPLGSGRTAASRFRDPMGLFFESGHEDDRTGAAAAAQRRQMTPAERAAVDTLGLQLPVSADDVKLRYKSLAKSLHPDSNGGDKKAEERLKSVNLAYTTLRHSDRLK